MVAFSGSTNISQYLRDMVEGLGNLPCEISSILPFWTCGLVVPREMTAIQLWHIGS